jgi:hypothetical protein
MLPTEAMLEAEPALGPVLHDLQAQPVNELTLRESDNPEYVLALVASSGGAVIVPRQEPAVRARESTVDAIVRVADLVQDAAVEAMSAASVPPVWPNCPRHPGTHPLQAAVEHEHAVWRCPVDRITIAEVGALQSNTD